MAGSIYLPILSSFNASGVNAAKQSLGGLATAFDGVKRALGVASTSFVAFKAVSETIDFGRSSIVAARDLERNLNALDSVFGSLSPQMEAFAQNGVNIGLSQIQSAKASTFLGSVLKQAGFEMDVVADQTQNLVGLASDLAVTYGYDVSEALSGMTALFRGEYDPIEKFGVAMKQSEVNAVLAANGQDKLTGAARRSAEQQARLALLYQRTADAQGAFKEGAGTLFVEQQKLQAIFNNLQAEVGQALIPALVKVAEALQPLVKTLAPAITTLFTQFASVITILSSQLNNAQSSLYQFIGFMGELFKILVAVLPWILDNGLAVATFIAAFKGVTAVIPILQGLMVQLALLKMEPGAGATAAALFGGTMSATVAPLTLVAVGIAAITAGMVILAREMEKAKEANDNWSDSYNQLKKEAETDPFRSLTASSLGYGIALQGAIDKQNTLAAGPKASNSGVMDAYNYQKKTGTLKTSNPAEDFQKTLDALLKNFTGATGAVAKSTKSATDASAKAAKEALKARFTEFKADLKDLGKALNPLTVASREIGQFEQNVIDSFDAISKKLDAGIKDGTIGTKNLAKLRAYLTEQNKLIAAKAAERDAIVEKRNLAKTLIKDVTDAITGLGSLGGLLETETRQVTTSVTKIIDGFTVTTKRTVDEVVGGKGVISKLQAVVAKTKAFAKQLTDLKALGLDENLFKQIVEAGPDVGGELAKEILAGGADSVKSLNTTFKELQKVAGTIAEQTAVVMYGAGVDVADGLVNGLLAQEAAIVAAAQQLADAFNAAYNAKIGDLTIPSIASAPSAPVKKTVAPVQNININVKASAGTDTKKTGQDIAKAIKKYEKASGYGILAANKL